MLFVIGGLVTVGTSDMVTQKPCNTTTTTTNSTPTFSAFSYSAVSVHSNDCKNDTTSIFVGDLLIFSSQVIVATQMVLEEKFVTKYNVPALQAVGWEGTFGFTTLSLLLVPFSFIYVGESFGHGPRYVLEDAYDAVYQLAHNPLLLLAYFGEEEKILYIGSNFYLQEPSPPSRFLTSRVSPSRRSCRPPRGWSWTA